MDKKYYSMEKDEVIKDLESDYNKGLSDKEVLDRLKKYGKNLLPKKKRDSVFKIFFRQINSMLIICFYIDKFLTNIY